MSGHTVWISPGEFGRMKKEADFIERELVKEPPVPCDFKVGDIVTFTNEFGVVFPGKVITGFSREPITGRFAHESRFIHLAGGAYWFAHRPSELQLERRAD